MQDVARLCCVCGSDLVRLFVGYFFFFNDTATTEIYTLSLHDALPIWIERGWREQGGRWRRWREDGRRGVVL